MDGSITQLGLSNYLITKEGQAVSFFRNSYKNYSNYAKDTRILDFKNNVRFGQTISFRFDEDGKYGDLVTNVSISIDLPDISSYRNINNKKFGYCNGVGNAIAKNIILNIGGNIIDQHTSEWLDIYGQLTVKPGCKDNYFSMIKKFDDTVYTTTSFTGGRIYIPLQFWFCRNITTKNSSLVMPLSSLYNSTIEISLDLRNFLEIIVSEDGILTGSPLVDITDADLLVDYVILEEEERCRYINVPRQISIINQLQTYKYSVPANTIDYTFSLKSMKYPVIELIFVLRRNDAQGSNNYFNYGNSLSSVNNINPITHVRLIFDGRDRISTLPASNFTQVEPSKVHTNTPINKFIHVYSFALEPEKIEQPNGVCNFSELHEPLLQLTFEKSIVASTLFVYALNYNVLMSIEGSGYLLHNLSKSCPIVFPDISCMPTEQDYKQDYKQK